GRRPVLERLANSGRSGRKASARTVAELLSLHGGGGEGVVARASALTRERLDLGHVTHPPSYIAYVASGRRRGMAALARRFGPTFARTSRPQDGVRSSAIELDFTSAATVDRHAGPGWWKLDERGLWSHGGEGRIVVDVYDESNDLELSIVVCSSNQQTRVIEVRVNERALANVTVRPAVSTDLRLRVPAAVARRFQPMEVGFLGPPRGLGTRRGPVGIRLQRVHITPSAMSPASAPPESPSGSRRVQD
ncbi:MAG: hypothetical protein QOG30_935, partial [Acidimicrobiaceae bacterium]